MSVKLHPHQLKGIDNMHNGCILYGDVGVGKTITSLGYYFSKVCNGEINKLNSMKTPKDVYVITTAKVRDSKGFELQAAAYGIFEDRDKSTNGVKITVDSWNNLHKYVEVSDAFFIFDEQRVVGYGAWSRAFIKVAKHNEFILLSATPGDTWMDYIPIFIANGWYKHKTDFTDQHVIWTPRVKYPKVLRYQDVGTLVRRRNEVLVHMPYERHTVRHPVDIWCDFSEDLFNKVVNKKWHVYEERPLRDASELFSVMRKVVNSDESRLNEVRRLLSRHRKLIVFYNFDYELETLRKLGASLSTDSTSLSTGSTESVGCVGENPSEPSKRSETSTEGSKSTSSSTMAVCPSSCEGHWTTDRGQGESFLTCSQWNQAVSASREKSLRSSSKGSSTTLSPPSKSPGSTTSSRSEPESGPETSSGVSQVAAHVTNASTSSCESAKNFTVAEWNGHKHEEIPKTDGWLYLVQYRAGAEGWNCVETDAICFYSQTYSYRDWWQAHGRIDRLNTPFTDLWYYHLVSRSLIDKAIRKALKTKKNFNERDLDLKVA